MEIIKLKNIGDLRALIEKNIKSVKIFGTYGVEVNNVVYTVDLPQYMLPDTFDMWLDAISRAKDPEFILTLKEQCQKITKTINAIEFERTQCVYDGSYYNDTDYDRTVSIEEDKIRKIMSIVSSLESL